MPKFLNPEGVPKPASPYSQVVDVKAPFRMVEIAGQVGVRPDGTPVKDPAEQFEQAFANLLAALKGVGLGPKDLVKTTAFLTRREDLATYRATRARMFGDAVPASTLLFVAGLANPDFVFEIEGTAVREG